MPTLLTHLTLLGSRGHHFPHWAPSASRQQAPALMVPSNLSSKAICLLQASLEPLQQVENWPLSTDPSSPEDQAQPCEGVSLGSSLPSVPAVRPLLTPH